MRSCFRVYLKPFDDDGVYTDWVEISDAVEADGIGNLAQDLDNTEWDIGVYRNSSLSLKLRNDDGRFSDVGGPNSLFHYKRSNSMVKLTWEIEQEPWQLGISPLGTLRLTEEMVLFTGLLSDESMKMDAVSQRAEFTVLGRESIFQKTEVDFGALSNGMLMSAALLAVLDQTTITDLLTVDAGNISCGLDQAIDAVAWFQNKTAQEALAKLLLASNSVLYTDGDEIIVAPRTAGASVAHSFYGQASANIESIQAITNIKTGLAKTFNYFTWKDATTLVFDADSVAKYGVRKKQLDFEFMTDTTRRGNLMAALLAEFKFPRQEFELTAFLNYETLEVSLLNKVSVDYPTVFVPKPGETLPICGVAICGSAVLPRGIWGFTVEPTDYLKVMSRSLDIKNSLFKFKLRKVA